MTGSRKARRGAAGAAGALALLGAGCGGDAKPERAARVEVTATEPAKGRVAYRAPRTVRAGLVELAFENRASEPRKAQLVRIHGDHSIREALRVRAPLPRWFNSEGGVGMTAPGAKASVTQRLAPGRYYITDTRGARAKVAPLTVTGGEAGSSLPETEGSIVSLEYSFIARGIRAGRSSIEFSNDGLEPHHAVIAPVRRGSSVPALRRFLRGRGPIPVGEVVNLRGALETAVIEAGQRQVVQLRLEPGRYALLCFVPDRRGGPTHVAKGMVDALTVR